MDLMANGMMSGLGQAAGGAGAQFLNTAGFGGMAPFLNPNGIVSPMSGMFQTLIPSGVEESGTTEANEETVVVIKKKPKKPLLLTLVVFPIIIAVITVVVVAVTNTVVVVATGFFPNLFPKKNQLVQQQEIYPRPVYEMRKPGYKPSYRRRRSNPEASGSPLLDVPSLEQLTGAVRDTLASEECLSRAFCDSATITSNIPGMGLALSSFSSLLPENLKWMGEVITSAGQCSKYKCAKMD